MDIKQQAHELALAYVCESNAINSGSPDERLVSAKRYAELYAEAYLSIATVLEGKLRE